MRLCHWKLVEGIWYTGCGDAWPDQRHMAWRHCPLCGLRLAPDEQTSVSPQSEDDDWFP
jgi:hypothetical protein